MSMTHEKIKCIITLLVSFLLFSCSSIQTDKKYLVLNYSDFGPPSLSEGLIGQDWWQWKEYKDSRSGVYDIKVVVYRGFKLQDAQKQYPTIPKINQDYRYISYDKAIAFLNDSIEELTEFQTSVSMQLVVKFKETKVKIENEMVSKSIDVNFRLDQRIEGF